MKAVVHSSSNSLILISHTIRGVTFVPSVGSSRSQAYPGKVRGHGSANVGVPLGSPLSPVVFLIWLAPILTKLEERVREGTGLDVEMPSFVDDMCADVIDWEGDTNMQLMEMDVKRIVREVEECNLPGGTTPQEKPKKEECRGEVCQVAGSHF